MREQNDKLDVGKIGVYIADRYPVFRRGLESHFADTPDLVAAGKGGTVAAMISGIKEEGVNILLLDVTLSGSEYGLIVQQLRQEYPALPILLVTESLDARGLLKGIRAGALGVVTRDASFNEMERAIRRIAAGQPYLPEWLAEQLVLHYQRHEDKPLDEKLSPREFVVMQWLTQGAKLSEIARKLNVSHQTITTHRRHILKKTGFRTTAEIIRYGILNAVGTP